MNTKSQINLQTNERKLDNIDNSKFQRKTTDYEKNFLEQLDNEFGHIVPYFKFCNTKNIR